MQAARCVARCRLPFSKSFCLDPIHPRCTGPCGPGWRSACRGPHTLTRRWSRRRQNARLGVARRLPCGRSHQRSSPRLSGRCLVTSVCTLPVKIPRASASIPPDADRPQPAIARCPPETGKGDAVVQNTGWILPGRGALDTRGWQPLWGQPLAQQRPRQLRIPVAGKVEATSRPVKGRLPEFAVVPGSTPSAAHPLDARRTGTVG
jgi:hypothetical protein